LFVCRVHSEAPCHRAEQSGDASAAGKRTLSRHRPRRKAAPRLFVAGADRPIPDLPGPRSRCPKQGSPGRAPPPSLGAAGSQQNCSALPARPGFIRAACKSLLFPHKPKIILVLSTGVSSLIIARVLCDTKSFAGRFKRSAAQIRGQGV